MLESFLKIINLSFQEKKKEINIVSEKISRVFLPTIFDTNGNRLAYSDFNFSIFKVNNKFEYLERDASSNQIKETLYFGSPRIKV